MTNYINKWPVIVIAAMLVAIFFFIGLKPDSLQLACVKVITLSPTDVVLPSVRSQLERSRVAKQTKYVFRNDGDQYHLYSVENGTFENVVGDMPTFTADPNLDFSGFTDVVSPSGTTTYASYVKYKALFIDGFELVASELYAIKGNRVQKILSNIQPAGINTIDKRISLGGAYLDQRGNLYVLTLDGMLCVIQDGQVIAKANVNDIGAKYPALPSMFSDAGNTYFLVPKLSRSSRIYGPVRESDIKAKYEIEF